jgi:hypothetical protein
MCYIVSSDRLVVNLKGRGQIQSQTVLSYWFPHFSEVSGEHRGLYPGIDSNHGCESRMLTTHTRR